MPTYNYECLKCGDGFEAFQNMSDSPLKSCPKCKGEVKRLIGPGLGLIFKGSGFYATDYKNKFTGKGKSNSVSSQCSGCKDSSCPQANKEGADV